MYLFVYFIRLQWTWLNETSSLFYIQSFNNGVWKAATEHNSKCADSYSYELCTFHFEIDLQSQSSGCSFSYSFLHQIQKRFLCITHPIFMSNHSEPFSPNDLNKIITTVFTRIKGTVLDFSVIILLVLLNQINYMFWITHLQE